MKLRCIQISMSLLCISALSYGMKNEIEVRDDLYIRQHCMHWSDQEVASIEPLMGGRGGSRLYTVHFAQDEPCVVRLLSSPYAREKEYQESEITSMYSASEAGVGPQIFAAQTKDEHHELGYVVMQKINTIVPQNILCNNAGTYVSLGELLHKMHAQPCVIPIDKEAMYRRANFVMNDLKKKWQEAGVEGLLQNIQQVGSFFEESKSILNSYPRTHLVHGDLIVGNLLHDGSRFWAIDWEHSRVVAHPLFDVALVQECFVPDMYRMYFMRAYCGDDELPKAQLDIFNRIRIFACCLIGMTCARLNSTEFSNLFHHYTDSQINVKEALHSMIHGGYTGEITQDKKEIVTFGTLLFMLGYKQLQS